MTTRQKLQHIAAQIDQLASQLEAMARPVDRGGDTFVNTAGDDCGISASHEAIVIRD